ncbi:MAG: hypothetical protein V1735_04185 [Nanoarchaeota archaeon]
MDPLALMVMSLITFSPFRVDCEYWTTIYGYVYDAEDGTSSLGRTVYAYLPEDESYGISCTIYEGDPGFPNWYLCPICEIPGFIIEDYNGTNFSTRVLDSGDGYVAGPVNTTITYNAIDVAPDMTLAPALQILSPPNGTRSSRTVYLDALSLYPYQHALYYKIDSAPYGGPYCMSCSSIQQSLQLGYGLHTIAVKAEAADGAFVERAASIEITRPSSSPLFVKPILHCVQAPFPYP